MSPRQPGYLSTPSLTLPLNGEGGGGDPKLCALSSPIVCPDGRWILVFLVCLVYLVYIDLLVIFVYLVI